jgi:hypothetical protein
MFGIIFCGIGIIILLAFVLMVYLEMYELPTITMEDERIELKEKAERVTVCFRCIYHTPRQKSTPGLLGYTYHSVGGYCQADQDIFSAQDTGICPYSCVINEHPPEGYQESTLNWPVQQGQEY